MAFSTAVDKGKSDIKSSKDKALRKILKQPHIEALISDSFWYIICIFFKRDSAKYHDKKEQLLDRIAANFVSFFIRYRSSKQNFIFSYFYDLISQAVFFSLFFAYPKSRTKFDIYLIFKLLKEFAGLFNGPRIRNPSLALIKHWTLDLGTGNIIENLRQSMNFGSSKYKQLYDRVFGRSGCSS